MQYKPRTLKGAHRRIRQLQQELDERNSRVFVEANKGGTCVEITNTGKENRCLVTVGQYCVYHIDGEFDVESVAIALITGLSKPCPCGHHESEHFQCGCNTGCPGGCPVCSK
jgi:hypothetical protein